MMQGVCVCVSLFYMHRCIWNSSVHRDRELWVRGIQTPVEPWSQQLLRPDTVEAWRPRTAASSWVSPLCVCMCRQRESEYQGCRAQAVPMPGTKTLPNSKGQLSKQKFVFFICILYIFILQQWALPWTARGEQDEANVSCMSHGFFPAWADLSSQTHRFIHIVCIFWEYMFSLDNVIDLRTWSCRSLTFIRLPELATPTSKWKIIRLIWMFPEDTTKKPTRHLQRSL